LFQGAGKGKRVMGGKPHQGDVQMADAAAQGGQAAHAAPGGRIPIPRSAVRLPLEVSTHLECKWRDGKMYPSRIIERRKMEGGTPDQYEYYVHYRNCEWRQGV
jgi:histone acetyltransferase MYST1